VLGAGTTDRLGLSTRRRIVFFPNYQARHS
jgi:hypothetical protein